MQIDFHHGTTYVLARWAGFSHTEAEVVAMIGYNNTDRFIAAADGIVRFMKRYLLYVLHELLPRYGVCVA